MAFIEENVEGSKNKLNLSINEKEDLEDLDDEQVEQEFTAFLKDINKDEQAKEFLDQMNLLMESGFNENKTFNDDFLFDTTQGNSMEGFANSCIKQLVKKEVIYEPLKEARKQMQSFMGASEANRTLANKEKLKLINDCLQILESPDHSKPAQTDELVRLFEKLNEKGGLPDEMLKKCMGGGEYKHVKQMMKEGDCLIF